MLTISFVISIVFFGGFNDMGFIPGGIAILLKVAFFVFLFVWVSAAFPYIRPDQLLFVC